MGVVKIDTCAAAKVATGDLPSNVTTVTVFHHQDVYLGEPLFVPNPEAVSEDDGTILVVSMNASSSTAAMGETALLAIDALTMQQVARITAPFPTPFEFHGQFIPR